MGFCKEKKKHFFVLVEKSVASRYGQFLRFFKINSKKMDRTTMFCNKKL